MELVVAVITAVNEGTDGRMSDDELDGETHCNEKSWGGCGECEAKEPFDEGGDDPGWDFLREKRHPQEREELSFTRILEQLA